MSGMPPQVSPPPHLTCTRNEWCSCFPEHVFFCNLLGLVPGQDVRTVRSAAGPVPRPCTPVFLFRPFFGSLLRSQPIWNPTSDYFCSPYSAETRTTPFLPVSTGFRLSSALRGLFRVLRKPTVGKWFESDVSENEIDDTGAHIYCRCWGACVEACVH